MQRLDHPAPPVLRVRPDVIDRLSDLLDENGFLVVVLGGITMGSLLVLRRDLISDSWLALVAGRWIVHHGLPSHDFLAVMTHGRRWVDQQWLAQIALYGLWRLGGLKLALLIQAALSTTAIVAAAMIARRLGATARATAWVALPAYVAYYPVAWTLRAQALAFPLFSVTLWLVLSDVRRPSRRVFVTLPLLALWANLHGSVVLGCALVSLHGAVILLRQDHRSRRGLVLLIAPWACLFASPYALQLPGYYEKVLVGADFKAFVSEWAPTTLTATTAPAYLLVLGGLWLLGRAGRDLPLLDKLAFTAGAVLAFDAIRNIAWIALIALAVLPPALDRLLRPSPAPRTLNRLLSGAVLVAAMASLLVVVVRPAAWFSSGEQRALAHVAADAAGHDGRVFATVRHADWLLWSAPHLVGRVAFDDRFELLSGDQLQALASLGSSVRAWRSVTRNYRVLVLDGADPTFTRTLMRALPARLVFNSPSGVVLQRLHRASGH